MEDGLDESKACVVFIGPTGIGPWQNEEMRTALDDRVRGKPIRVVPVVLPRGKRLQKESELPRFLRRLIWQELKDVDNEAELHLLRCRHSRHSARDRNRSKQQLKLSVLSAAWKFFREQDARFFFGRESEVQQLADYFEQNRFLAVIGTSGRWKIVSGAGRASS